MRHLTLLLLPLCAIAAAPLPVSISVSSAAPLATSHPTNFASFSFDWTALFGVQRTAIPFSDPRLIRLARNLAPAFVRFGGSLQDRSVAVFPGVPQPPPAPPTLQQVLLNESTFDTLAAFADAAGLDLVLGLNAAVGRQLANGSSAPWLLENALAPLARAAARGQRVAVVELGNEVNVFNCSTDGLAKMSPAALAAQYAALAERVRALLPGAQLWGSDSSITGDEVGQCRDYFGADLFGFNRALLALPQFSSALDAHTWHWYAQDSRNATSTASLILTPEYQDRLPAQDALARAVRDASAPGLPIALGETASYWAGGAANVSNRFGSGFWYLPQLGYLASKGYTTHIRQDLAGANYGLLDLQMEGGAVTGYAPNPDYFTHALWQRVMGHVALAAAVRGGEGDAGCAGVRAWASCAARAAGGGGAGVALVLVNFCEADAAVSFPGLGGARREWALTPGDAALGLASQAMLLNGEALRLGAEEALPPLRAREVDGGAPFLLAGRSYAFVAFPEAGAAACRAGAASTQAARRCTALCST